MINEGDIVFLDYGEAPQVIHCRLVAAPVQNDIYVIVTPDCLLLRRPRTWS